MIDSVIGMEMLICWRLSTRMMGDSAMRSRMGGSLDSLRIATMLLRRVGDSMLSSGSCLVFVYDCGD